MPSDLLSPHGEGYCGRCAFVIGLDPLGRLDPHTRGRRDGFAAYACPGGGRPPWKSTPYYSTKARFSTSGGKGFCTDCQREIPVTVSVITGTRLKWHTSPDNARDCPGTNRLIK